MVHVVRFVLVGGLFAIMILSRRSIGTWANPVVFYAGPFAFVAIGQEALLPNLPFGALMAALVLSSTIALYLGVLVTWRRPETMVDPPRLPDARRTLRTIGLGVAFAIALLYLYEIREALATGLGTNEQGYFDRAAFFASGGQTPLLRALQALSFCGAFYVAFEARQRRRPALLVGGYLLIMFVQGVLFSAKLGVLIGLLIFLTMVAVGYPTRFRKIDRRVLASAAAGLLVVIVIFHIVATDRSRGTSDASAVTGYAILGPPSAYSLVLEGNATIGVDPRWGMTIAGLRDLVAGGGDTRQFGVFVDTVQLDPGKRESMINIYTWFVPLRNDFGLPGMFVFIFWLGLTTGALTTRQVSGRLGIFGQTGLALLNLGLVFAPISALTYYNFVWLLLAMGVPAAWLYRQRPPGPGDLPPHQTAWRQSGPAEVVGAQAMR